MTENTNKLTNLAIQKLVSLAHHYDRFTCYIENYRQEQEAEKRNEEIVAEFIETAEMIGVSVSNTDFFKITNATGTVYSKITVEEAVNNMLQEKGFELNNNKEEEIMSETTNTTATINNETTIKEETTMTTLAERTLNMNKTERLVYVWDIIIHVTKTSDELYIKKEELAQFLFDNDIISRMPGKNELKKTKRQEFVDILDTAVQNLIKNKVITPINAVPVEIVSEEVKEVAQVNNDPRAKTDKLFALIKACADSNNKKGFGYTISSFMLQACILNAGAGISKLKGHTVTAEENKMTQDIYSWLKKKGFIKPLVYSVVEDENIRVYTPEYSGNTNTKTVKMIPWAQSKGYTAKKVTSFLVCIK